MMGFGLLCISLSREIPDEVKTGESRRDEDTDTERNDSVKTMEEDGRL